ncbi:hypothetical protein A176_006899 [Myxococcus hansupus]|uniref:Uncharacterized protein n=1 Tax=Pseudomyxococcus hansupus TaxID=1297742 RepID=A0A0H4XNQ3_9BACT|nr:hypothetical protein A176_006899 [Myxococcus hansupus]
MQGDVDAGLVCDYYEAGEFGVAGTLRSQLAVFSNPRTRKWASRRWTSASC